MLVNILRISASNALKTFLNMTVSKVGVQLVFSIRTNQLEAQIPFIN